MKRSLAAVFFILLICSAVPAESMDEAAGRDPQVALVLSGGAALGFAHIGVLKVIEELGIPVDIVVGTSMGGLAGGLYAIGYTPEEIQEIVASTDWVDLFLPPSSPYDYYFGPVIDGEQNILSFSFDKDGFGTSLGVISDQKILSMLSRITSKVSYIDDFDQFSRRFRCVGVNLLTGEEKVFDSGRIADAMRATMSIPTVFSPYEIDGNYYLDGGVRNNLPVDVARSLGADIIIAVDVDSEQISSPEKLNSSIDILTQTLLIILDSTEDEHAKLADLVIQPDLSGLNAAMFTEYEEFIKRGEAAARELEAKLISLRDQVSKTRDNPIPAPEREGVYANLPNPEFHTVSLATDDELFPLDLFEGIRETTLDHATLEELDRSINRIVATGRYDSIRYALVPADDGFDLEISPILSDRGRNSIGLGFAFDAEYSANLAVPWYLDPALTASLVFTELFGTHAYAMMDMKLGEQFKLDLELFTPIGSFGYIHPTVNLYNEELTAADETIKRSILLSARQEAGLLFGRFTEIGAHFSEYISWLYGEDPEAVDVQTDIDLVFGPSFIWKDTEHHPFIHSGIIHSSFIEFSMIPSDSWYHRIFLEHDHHIPITEYGTLSYDLHFGSYSGRFTNRQMGFDIGGWDGIPGYLTSRNVYNDALMIGVAYQHRFKTISEVIGADIYGITQFRLGNGWDEFPGSPDEIDLKFGSGAGIGISSFLGDVIIGVGINQDAGVAYYILMN